MNARTSTPSSRGLFEIMTTPALDCGQQLHRRPTPQLCWSSRRQRPIRNLKVVSLACSPRVSIILFSSPCVTSSKLRPALLISCGWCHQPCSTATNTIRQPDIAGAATPCRSPIHLQYFLLNFTPLNSNHVENHQKGRFSHSARRRIKRFEVANARPNSMRLNQGVERARPHSGLTKGLDPLWLSRHQETKRQRQFETTSHPKRRDGQPARGSFRAKHLHEPCMRRCRISGVAASLWALSSCYMSLVSPQPLGLHILSLRRLFVHCLGVRSDGFLSLSWLSILLDLT